MRQEYVPSRAHRAANALIERRRREADTYIGVAPRTRQEGARDAVNRVHALWADLDTPEAMRRASALSLRPAWSSPPGTASTPIGASRRPSDPMRPRRPTAASRTCWGRHAGHRRRPHLEAAGELQPQVESPDARRGRAPRARGLHA